MDEIRKNEIGAVILFAIGLFIFLSISTFDHHDLSLFTSDPNIQTQNLTGIFGAYIGAILLFAVGKAAYVFPFLVIVWGISRIMKFKPRKIFYKLFGTAVLVYIC